jgi:hypothetical protein
MANLRPFAAVHGRKIRVHSLDWFHPFAAKKKADLDSRAASGA